MRPATILCCAWLALAACGRSTIGQGAADGAGANGGHDSAAASSGRVGGQGGSAAGGAGASGGHAAADASSGGFGGTAEPTTTDSSMPMLDGIPIGDCRAQSAAELATAGCPAVAPLHMSDCKLPTGTSCRYELTVSKGYVYQEIATCNREMWAVPKETCGVSCDLGLTNTADLPDNDCQTRVATDCEGDPSAFLGSPATAQERLDAALGRVISDCGGMDVNTVQVQVVDGCPRRLSSESPLDSRLYTCLLSTLVRKRWTCAKGLLCGESAVILLVH